MRIDPEDFKRRLSEIGADKVRERLASNTYSDEEIPMVKEWLSSLEKKKRDVIIQRDYQLAQSAKYAAWVAAIAAIISVLAAIASIIW